MNQQKFEALLDTATLRECVERGILSAAQATALETHLKERQSPPEETQFSLVHLCWYGGTAVVLVAFGLFAHGIERAFGTSGVAAVMSAYAVIACFFSIVISFVLKSRSVLSGLLLTGAILIACAAILVFQVSLHTLKYFPFPNEYSDSYLALSLPDQFRTSPLLAVTLATCASSLALYTSRFIPLVVLVTAGFSYLLIDVLAPRTVHQLELAALALGGLTVFVGWWADRRARANFGYWLNKMGMWAIPLGLLLFFDNSEEVSKILFVLLNVLVIVLALYLRRPAGVLGGAGAIFLYLNHLYDKFFHDSLVFPFFIVLLGTVVVFVGWKLYRSSEDLDRFLPHFLVRHRPSERTDPVVFGA